MKRVLIVDDHGLLRRGLRGILAEAFPGVEVGEAADAREALKVIEQPWEMILLDISMPGRSGIDLLEDLKRLRPQLPVIVLSALPERDYALRALKLGAAGYLSKHTAESELVAAIRKASAGGRYVSPQLAEILAAAAAGETTDLPHETLSNREMQVLRLVASGKTLKEIASELGLSEKTIGTYRMRLSQKLGLGTNVELARYALQHRLAE